VLLTGASGFVGRQIHRALAERGAVVRVVVRGGRPAPIDEHRPAERVIWTPDLFAESAEWWARTSEGVDTIVHAAWYAEPGKYLQSARNMDCLCGTLELAKGAVRSGVRRVVGIGTCAEYDMSAGTLTVDTPLRPESPYAAAKAAAFLALAGLLPVQGVELAWCRLFYLYGEGEDERRLVPYLRSRLAAGEVAELTSGNQVRDFLDVRDAGRMIAECALSERQGAVNICSGVPTTVRELAERIADEYGRRDLLRFGARPENLFDPPSVVGIA
jgi:dTDP-6-deoxy-L-talose 4-dehydrogenase (NAD+)